MKVKSFLETLDGSIAPKRMRLRFKSYALFRTQLMRRSRKEMRVVWEWYESSSPHWEEGQNNETFQRSRRSLAGKGIMGNSFRDVLVADEAEEHTQIRPVLAPMVIVWWRGEPCRSKISARLWDISHVLNGFCGTNFADKQWQKILTNSGGVSYRMINSMSGQKPDVRGWDQALLERNSGTVWCATSDSE